jgi:PAS domain S-box-containing protein
LSPDERSALHRRWRPLIPLTIAVVSLLLLVLGLVYLDGRTRMIVNSLANVTQPARRAVTEIELALALDIAGTRGYLLTGDQRFVTSHVEARATRTGAEARLIPLSRQLGPEVARAAATLEARSGQVDAGFDSLYAGHLSKPEFLQRIDERQSYFASLIADAGRLDTAIFVASTERMRQFRDTRRLGSRLLMLLALVVFIALILLLRLGTGFQARAIRLDQRERHQSSIVSAVRASEERFRQVAENIRSLVWLRDPATRQVLYANTAYEEIWGRSRESLYRDLMSWLDGVHADDRARVAEVLESQSEFDLEYRVVRPSGETRWVWTRGFPVRDERGNIYRTAGVTEDITDRHLAELAREQLAEQERTARKASEEAKAAADRRREELERVTDSRARLVRGFSHDVKNPLGAADGFLALLEDGVMGELANKQRDGIVRARTSIRRALELIGRALELAQAEAGELELRRITIDLRKVIDEAAGDYHAQAEAKGLELTMQLSHDLPAIESDPVRIRQIISNLLSNAIKYTPEKGSIGVRVGRDGAKAPAPGDWVVVEVSDTGRGIPADKMGMVFQEFTRLDPENTRGAGVGLAISQRVAHALGGMLTVESKEGTGSRFSLWLPLKAPV